MKNRLKFFLRTEDEKIIPKSPTVDLKHRKFKDAEKTKLLFPQTVLLGEKNSILLA